jgi:hypothetical protein
MAQRYFTKQTSPAYPVLNIVAAGLIAFHKNGDKMEKYDAPAYDSGDYKMTATVSNKTIAMPFIKDPATIPQEAMDEATLCIQYIQGQAMMDILSGKAVSSFMRDMLALLEVDTVPEFRVGMLLYAANTFHTGKARDVVKEKVSEMAYTSQALGKVGDKVAVNFTLIDKRYIQQFDCWAAGGNDDKGNLVSFLTKHEKLCVSGKITGKVKSAGADKWRGNAMVTALNFVKAAT